MIANRCDVVCETEALKKTEIYERSYIHAYNITYVYPFGVNRDPGAHVHTYDMQVVYLLTQIERPPEWNRYLGVVPPIP